jgi:uncharacterized protein (TIGR02265 family)
MRSARERREPEPRVGSCIVCAAGHTVVVLDTVAAPTGFEHFDWEAPLDLRERLANAPDDVFVKGMFFEQVRETIGEDAAEAIDPGGRYQGFRGYPIRRWLTFLADAARISAPDRTLRAALFELGQPTYPRLKQSLIGRVIFTFTSFEASLRVAKAAYRRTAQPVELDVHFVERRHAVLELRHVWDFAEWHAGIFRGALEAFGLEGEILVHRHHISAFDLELRW